MNMAPIDSSDDGVSWYAVYTFQDNDTTLMKTKIQEIPNVSAEPTKVYLTVYTGESSE